MFYIGSKDVKEQREASIISGTAKFHSTLRGGIFLCVYVGLSLEIRTASWKSFRRKRLNLANNLDLSLM